MERGPPSAPLGTGLWALLAEGELCGCARDMATASCNCASSSSSSEALTISARDEFVVEEGDERRFLSGDLERMVLRRELNIPPFRGCSFSFCLSRSKSPVKM